MTAIQQMQGPGLPSDSKPASTSLSMQSGPYAGCTVLEGKPIAVPGPPQSRQTAGPLQGAHNPYPQSASQHSQQHSQQLLQEHIPNGPPSQGSPHKPVQAFQHMPCPPKISGRPYAQIRVKAEPTVLVHSSQLQPQYLAPVADMAQPLASLHPTHQAQQHPHNAAYQGQPMGTLRGPSPYSTMAGTSQHNGPPIQTAVVLAQRPLQNGITFVRSAQQQQPQRLSDQQGQALQHSHAQGTSSHQQGPYLQLQASHQQMVMSEHGPVPTRNPHQRSQSDGQLHMSSAHPGAAYGGPPQERLNGQQNGQAAGQLQPRHQQMSQDTHPSEGDGPSQDGPGILGMPPIPSQAQNDSTHPGSPARITHSQFQGTPFALMSPPFPRHNSGPPVMQQQGHGVLLGPVQSAPPELEGEVLEFRMGSAGPNKSRYRGVSYDKKKRKWRVQIKVHHSSQTDYTRA